MIVTIEQTEDTVIQVNGKPVIHDLDYNWVGNFEITPEERSAFQCFVTTKKKYPRLVKVVFNF